jgi:putative ABC transport system substrate-binding protein
LARREVAVITAIGGPATALAAKAATTKPVVFLVGGDPVRHGLVTSLARPGGTLTGINFFVAELAAKRLELLREMVPTATHVAALINPTGPDAEITSKDLELAAGAMGLQIRILNASTSGEINEAFANLVRSRPNALFVGSDPFFSSRRVQIAHLASHNTIPTTYAGREYVEAGGLMSYGTSVTGAWRQVGVYTGRILKGQKPADLPVVQPSKFELVINTQTARMLGLTVPPTLLALADEVIE